MTAMVVLTAMYFGGEAGFLTGALTALLSNFYFGQGPWTPFQMFTWGLLGFFAGLLRNLLKSSAIFLAVYGAFAGVAFSLIMDVWSALWVDGTFQLARYAAAVATSLGYMAIYAVSNVIFLLLCESRWDKFWAESRRNTGLTERGMLCALEANRNKRGDGGPDFRNFAQPGAYDRQLPSGGARDLIPHEQPQISAEVLSSSQSGGVESDSPGGDGTAGRDGASGGDGAPGRNGASGGNGTPGRDGASGGDGTAGGNCAAGGDRAAGRRPAP